jgi:ParB-like chromosome segregation protein Spo0J
MRLNLNKLIINSKFRTRKLNNNHIEILVKSIKEIGQMCSINVYRKGNRYSVVSGFARVKAMKKLKCKYIYANVIKIN